MTDATNNQDPALRERVADIIDHFAGSACDAGDLADAILAALSATPVERWRREAFNAGYSYGIESEASPEEYDFAWSMYLQSGRTAPDEGE